MEILRLTPDNGDEVARFAASVLKKGGIVVFPTDTLYGLAVDIANPTAVERLRELKGRERKKPVSVIVENIDAIERHVELHPDIRKVAERHLPGPLTIVLPAKSHIHDTVTLNGMLGVRVPNDPFALALARAFGKPYTATSANQSRMSTPATALEIIGHFGTKAHHLDLVIDGGERAGSIGSTVVTYIDGVPYILREGYISRDDLVLE